MKKIVFVTGTRADYGKMKSLMKATECDSDFEAFIYVTGMHLDPLFGSTYHEVEKDGYSNIYLAFENSNSNSMSINLGKLVVNFTNYVNSINPDLIVVHGDRVDAFGAAIVGALNNIRVAHIEGGELSGTIDESIRHSISKLAHLHFVSNRRAKDRLVQLGESEKAIFIIGSPDIDIMLSPSLPSLDEVKKKYDIVFPDFSILMFHPVTTSVGTLKEHTSALVNAVIKSQENYVVIYPNNDMGSQIILGEYSASFSKNPHFKLFPSIRFESFLTLLKNCHFIIGNSSAGVREAPIYGIPTIDIGSRQEGRYSFKDSTIVHVDPQEEQIFNAIQHCPEKKSGRFVFGSGNSTQLFMKIIKNEDTWNIPLQKKFNDLENL